MGKRATKVERELLERRRVGGLLANCAYNLAQNVELENDTRCTLNELRIQWDAIERTKHVPARTRKAKR